MQHWIVTLDENGDHVRIGVFASDADTAAAEAVAQLRDGDRSAEVVTVAKDDS